MGTTSAAKMVAAAAATAAAAAAVSGGGAMYRIRSTETSCINSSSTAAKTCHISDEKKKAHGRYYFLGIFVVHGEAFYLTRLHYNF